MNIRVVPDTDLVGYPANNLAGKRISGLIVNIEIFSLNKIDKLLVRCIVLVPCITSFLQCTLLYSGVTLYQVPEKHGNVYLATLYLCFGGLVSGEPWNGGGGSVGQGDGVVLPNNRLKANIRFENFDLHIFVIFRPDDETYRQKNVPVSFTSAEGVGSPFKRKFSNIFSFYNYDEIE